MDRFYKDLHCKIYTILFFFDKGYTQFFRSIMCEIDPPDLFIKEIRSLCSANVDVMLNI